jgi:23S rRNA (guanosine2251-2'-O)-methyltransferase
MSIRIMKPPFSRGGRPPPPGTTLARGHQPTSRGQQPTLTVVVKPNAKQPGTQQPGMKHGLARAERSSGGRSSGPEAPPRGTVWLYGQHVVAAALTNPARRLRRLLLTEEAEAALKQQKLIEQHGQWPITPERVDNARLERLLGRETAHQGAALLADLLTAPMLTKALERSGPVVVLDQVSDPRNVGAILRSAAAFGASAVVVQDRHAPEETGALAKAASGALETVPLLRAVNLSRTLVALKAAGCWVVGLDASGAPLAGRALADRRIALVVGAEGSGLRRLTRETCDEIAGLAMPGGLASGIESLNVSVATGVALYELARLG